MNTMIGTYGSKAKFSELLRHVQASESFTITRNGKSGGHLTKQRVTEAEIETGMYEGVFLER